MIEPRAAGGGRPVLMDFGLARDASATEHLTETGMVMGTPAYMAPEQAQGDQGRIDHRSDVYGLGAMLYELMCGQPPFDGQSTVQVLITVMSEDPVPLGQKNPGVPVDVETIVMKCLNKEPQRRYSTAMALAQDLGRYLSGEPIEARQTTLTYRLAKKVRKYRSLVALSSLLIVAVAALLIVGVHSRLREAAQKRHAAAQAQLAQRLGQDVKEMELFMRAAYALPLHDIRRERQVVRKRMAQIEELTRTLAVENRGPAYYTLGRGHMVLHELEEAQKRLQKAVSAGYETPEVDEALGQTMGAIYDQELAHAKRTSDLRTFTARKKQLQSEIRVPALQYLERSSNVATESKALRLAALSWLRGDLQNTLQAAQQAETELPWDPEPLRLHAVADYHLRNQNMGTTPEVDPERDRIAALFARLTDIARSDPEAHLAEALFWSQETYRDFISSRDVRPSIEHLKSASERALVADPSLFQARNMLAGAYSYLARWEEATGRDPQDSVRRSIAVIEPAQASNPEDSGQYVLINNLNLVAASFQTAHGIDPTAALDLAIASAKKGIRFHPNHWVLHNDLFSAQVQLIEHKITHAGNAELLFQEALQEAEFLRQLEQAKTQSNEHYAYYYLLAAENERLSGRDPVPLWEKALPVLRDLRRQRPHYDEFMGMTAATLLARAARLQATGGDAQALLEEAVPLIEQRIKESPTNPYGFLNRAALAELRARMLMQEARSPLAELARGLEAVAAARKLRAEQPKVPPAEAALLLLQARWLQQEHQRALPVLQQAERAALATLAPDNAELQLALASTLRLQQRELDARAGAQVLQRAEQAVAQARLLTPKLPRIDAEHAAIQLLNAERAAVPQQRQIARQALTLLTTALQRDPCLAWDYAALRARAQAMAGVPASPPAGSL